MGESKHPQNVLSPLKNSKGSKRAVWACGHTYLDLILHFACKVLDDEGGLQDWCAQEVLILLMLLLELGQQGVTCSMWEAADREDTLSQEPTVRGEWKDIKLLRGADAR